MAPYPTVILHARNTHGPETPQESYLPHGMIITEDDFCQIMNFRETYIAI